MLCIGSKSEALISGDVEMKRLLLLITLICIPFFSFGCLAAEGDFYCSYAAKTENGTLFYIDVFCDHKVAAAVFELGFDGSTAEYREVSAADPADTVRANFTGDIVTVAFASGNAKSGKLCRFTFNGLRAGDCLFSLHMRQACDDDLNYIKGLPDQSLTVSLGKDGRASGSSSSLSSSSASSGSNASAKTESKSSNSKSVKGDKSEISTADSDDSGSKSGLYDMRKNDPLRYILLGAGGVVLIGALVFAGYLIGRKKRAEAEPREDSASAGADAPEEKNE